MCFYTLLTLSELIMPKRKKTAFKLPYIGIDHSNGYDVLYNEKGEFGVVLEVKNPVLQYAADPGNYNNFHQLYVNAIKILGEGYIVQKQDILSRKNSTLNPLENTCKGNTMNILEEGFTPPIRRFW